MTWVYELGARGDPEREIVGGKALGLAQLLRFRHRIPSTLVLDVPAMDRIFPVQRALKRIGSKPVDILSTEIQRTILGVNLPLELLEEIAARTADWPCYCIRSSGVQEDGKASAWAGILCSCTNITLQELPEAIRRCWASLYSTASLEYAAHCGHRLHDLRIALIIQEFVAADSSGVAFSVEPVNGNAHTITIEAVKGSASAITDGSLIPDRYLVSKTSLAILDAQCASVDQCAMTRSQIQHLAHAVRTVESELAHAVDVEWTIKDDVLTLLQVRQVTTMGQSQNPPPSEPSVRFWWLDFDAMWQFVAGIQSFEAYPAVPANRMNRVLYIRENQSSRCLISVDDVLRLVETGLTLLDESTYQPFRKQVVDCIDQAAALAHDLLELDPKGLPAAALTARLLMVRDSYQRCVSLYRMFDPYMTGAIVTKLSPHLTMEAIGELLRPVDDHRSLEMADWCNLVAGEFNEAAALEHVRRYPWLVPNECDRASILTTLREKHEQQKQGNMPRAAAPLPEMDTSALPPDVQHAARILQELTDFRIRLKMAFTSFDYPFVELYSAISQMSGVPVRNLHRDYSIEDMVGLVNEGKAVLSTPLRVIEYRGRGLSIFEGERARAVLAGLKVSFDNESLVEGRLKGTVAYHGAVAGTVRIVNCNDVAKTSRVRQQMQQGDILVSEMIQLNITDLVQRAGGLITDEGGVLSHAAILAREFGIPCIVGTQRATQMLKDGDRVEIRTDEACVEVLSSSGGRKIDPFPLDGGGLGWG